jgi:hypothetical protein
MPLSAEHLETLARMDREVLELEYQARRLQLWLTLETAFRPDQLRVPAGNGIVSGRWTREGGGEGSGRADDTTGGPDEPRIIRVGDPDDPPGIGHNSEPSGVDQNLDDGREHTKPAEEPASILGVLLRTSAVTWALIAVELAAARALLRANTVAEPLSGPLSTASEIPTAPLPPPAPPGSFRVLDWKGYPAYLPRPPGPLRLLEGEEYAEARAAADRANQAIHDAYPELRGYHIHEIQPMKFGGDPRDLGNKIILDPQTHYVLNGWWQRLQSQIERQGP